MNTLSHNDFRPLTWLVQYCTTVVYNKVNKPRAFYYYARNLLKAVILGM